ncbi:MAG: NnrS family protein [Rhodocyclaceae bacterium]|nr:NnrS family protein [Rhodocyclaceae bacterium]MBK6906686.1 NnrS family protein [Rhodocyclaceae bacterium]
MPLLRIEDPAVRKAASGGFALFALGFRPFYLLAALFSALAVPAWLLVFSGHWTAPMPGALWHGHEMLFGFACAVIVGFLFTAGRNWTGLPTPTGAPLAALAGVWLAGRLMMAFAGDTVAGAVIDLAFLPAAAFALGRVLVQAKSHRNYFVLVLLSLLTLCNLGFHLARFGVLALDPLQAIWAALSLVTLLETAIGGRVIPMFTASALRGVKQWQHPRLNQAAIALTAVALLLWVLGFAVLGAPLALVAALLQLVRSAGWNPWATRRTPLLWILHLGHLWIPIGLLLLALTQWGWVPRSAAVHALTIGAIGGLIIGMMTRTALGHTGRMLVAGPVETSAYVLIQLAVLVRVASLLFVPLWAIAGINVAGSLWALAFGLYFVRYLPLLARARPDGRPG